jgi:hypothetical protein
MNRSLNDAFVVDIPVPSVREGYLPGDVNREAVFHAWEQLFAKNNRKIPTDFSKLKSLAYKYTDRAEELQIKETNKALAYMYFGNLLLLRILLTINSQEIVRTDKIDSVHTERSIRTLLRQIERQLTQEELTPIVK